MPSIHSYVISTNITDVLKYIENPQKTLVVFDIDGTLIDVEIDHEAPYQWFKNKIKEKVKEGLSPTEAQKKLLEELCNNKKFLVKIVEENTIQVVSNIQNQGTMLIGLTARFSALANFTKDNLTMMNIDFAQNGLTPNFIALPLDHPCIYKDGIISCGNNEKGTALISFLDHTHYMPELILFVDDRLSNILSVEQALKEKGIRCIAIHYQKNDDTPCIFQPIGETNETASERFIAWYQEITPDIKAKMIYSWQDDSPVPLSDLRYISVSHWDFDGNVHQGELVMHKEVAEDIVDIFRQLFAIRFPIQSILLIDHFEANDEKSMAANNCCAHCSRRVAGETRWSNHSFGTAIDINPLLNPYVRGDFFTPTQGEKYLDRTPNEPGMIMRDSEIYKIFTEKGWEWGAESFDHCTDYHHFQKVVTGLNKSKNE